MRFAIYMTASTVHFMSARQITQTAEPSSWLSLVAAIGAILLGFGFLSLACLGSKEGRDG